MQLRDLGRTGLKVSPLGFGGAPAAFLKSDVERTVKLLNSLLDAGLNLIDTAAAYPGSEAFIGDHLAARREEYVLVSKCGNVKVEGVNAPNWSRELVSAAVDRALKLLKTEHLDVMLLHSCDLETLKKGDAIGALIDAKTAGKIRHVGYSGDNEAAEHACTISSIEVVETSVNYLDQANIDRVLPAARANRVGIIAKRPVANAAWKGAADRAGIYVNYTKEYLRRHDAMNITAEEFGFTAEQWPELALRFTLSFPEVSTAIVGTTNPDNAKLNLEAAKKGPLPGDVVERIRAKFRATEGSAAWTGQT
jgi:aryl-alcohol dehydrogenase-like predicted oxidoreductase